MTREEYRAAFDSISFSADFQERTKALLNQEQRRTAEKENEPMHMRKTGKTAILIAAVVAALTLSVSAAVLLLTPAQVAEHVEAPLLAEAFESEGAVLLDETVESGDYAITLAGLVSGKGLSWSQDADESHTYAVLYLRRLDGTPLETQTFDFTAYTLTPLVAGCHPSAVNNWTLGSSATGFAQDGVYYYLLDTHDLGIFADHTVYLAFYEGSSCPSKDSFDVTEDTVAFADGFAGKTRALFELPLDPAQADPAAAEQFIKDTGLEFAD